MAVNDELIAIEAAHNTYVQRLAVGLGNDALPYTERMTERINERINREIGKNLTPHRREKLLADIEAIVDEELSAYTTYLKQEDKTIGKYEADFQAKTVGTLYPTAEAATVAASTVNQAADTTLIRIGEGSYTSYNQMLSGFTEKNVEQISNIVARGFIAGTSTRDIANQVMKEVDDRVIKTNKEAKSIAVTGTNHYANVGRRAYFDNDPLVIGWRFAATLDSITSGICRGLDGELFKKGERGYVAAQPPRHYNCRSAAVPEIDGRYKSRDEGGSRAQNFRDAESGRLQPKQINTRKIYYEALAGLDAKSMDLAIGPTLGKAYRKGLRDGTLTPESFAKMTIDDVRYNALTIEEMKERDNALADILKAQS